MVKNLWYPFMLIPITILICIYFFGDIILSTYNGVPTSVYFVYLSTKISLIFNPEGRYSLSQCDSESGGLVYAIASGRVFSDVSEIYFDHEGDKICSVSYAIDCRDHCPRCLNQTLNNCKEILAN